MAKTARSAAEMGRKTCGSQSSDRWTLADFSAWLQRQHIHPAFEVVHDYRGEHWLWVGQRSKAGYGVCWLNGKLVFVHRLSVLATDGEIEAGKQVRHRCQHKNCATRWHLLAGTQAENERDKHEAAR